MAVRFRDNRLRAKTSLRKSATDIITRKALEVEDNAKRSMQGGGRPHQPSRPGQPPRVDTGLLRSSITHEVESDLFSVEARVGTNVKYGLFLEIGTEKMEPRPWLRPALMKALGDEA